MNDIKIVVKGTFCISYLVEIISCGKKKELEDLIRDLCGAIQENGQIYEMLTIRKKALEAAGFVTAEPYKKIEEFLQQTNQAIRDENKLCEKAKAALKILAGQE